MAMRDLLGAAPAEGEEQWISVSDLMAGLMVLFIFIAISYMKDIIIDKNQIEEVKDQMEEVAMTFQNTQELIYQKLLNEFRKDLPIWKASIDQPTLTISFEEPSVLFESQSSQIKPVFQLILRDFFLRYLKVLDEFRPSIEEVRIEGHTSSEWIGAVTQDEAYFKNMELSQDRTRAVLGFALSLPRVKSYKTWAKQTITANGLSSSKPILVKGNENRGRSRRVDFRVRTNAEVQIRQILEVEQ
jgi:outer membrane protein OmpA-like peptidoglycan-associated protein